MSFAQDMLFLWQNRVSQLIAGDLYGLLRKPEFVIELNLSIGKARAGRLQSKELSTSDEAEALADDVTNARTIVAAARWESGFPPYIDLRRYWPYFAKECPDAALQPVAEAAGRLRNVLSRRPQLGEALMAIAELLGEIELLAPLLASKMDATTIPTREDVIKTGTGDLMDVKQVAELCQCSPRTVHRWVLAGDFPPSVKVGPHLIRWPRAVIQKWLQGRRASAGTIA